jgi:hypothetical protein
MTKQEAKEITLTIWQYLADHHEIKNKEDLPGEVFKLISGLSDWCALCHIFHHKVCDYCPLSFKDECYDYNRWSRAKTNKTRKKYAQAIVDKVKAWQPED